MNDDRANRFEEAFAQIKPIDEAHAMRLAKMRERLKEIGQDTSFEIEIVQQESREMQERNRASVEIAQEQARIAKEIVDGQRAEFSRQVDALERIVAGLRRGR